MARQWVRADCNIDWFSVQSSCLAVPRALYRAAYGPSSTKLTLESLRNPAPSCCAGVQGGAGAHPAAGQVPLHQGGGVLHLLAGRRHRHGPGAPHSRQLRCLRRETPAMSSTDEASPGTRPAVKATMLSAQHFNCAVWQPAMRLPCNGVLAHIAPGCEHYSFPIAAVQLP